MPRLAWLLTLIVALTATPLRLAEAADDQSRTLSQLDDEAEIEVIDGGVGDESGESIQTDTGHPSTDLAISAILPDSCVLIPPALVRFARPGLHDEAGARPCPSRRYLWFQCFLC